MPYICGLLRRMTAVLIFLGLVTGKAALATPIADLPMELRGTSPAVRVMVNGQGPFLFLIDTGAQGDARVDLSLVRKLKLDTAGRSLSGDGSGKNNRVLDRTTLRSIGIGRATFRNVTALARDYNRSASLLPISGILGFNLFKNHLLTLDFARKRVRIELGSLPAANGKGILNYEAPYDTPIIEMSMGSFRLLADIDSGDINSVTFPKSLVQILPHLGTSRFVGRSRTISNEFEVSEVQLRGNLRLGEHEALNPIVRYNDLHDNINLGAGFLYRYVVTFDQKNRRVRFAQGPESRGS